MTFNNLNTLLDADQPQPYFLLNRVAAETDSIVDDGELDGGLVSANLDPGFLGTRVLGYVPQGLLGDAVQRDGNVGRNRSQEPMPDFIQPPRRQPRKFGSRFAYPFCGKSKGASMRGNTGRPRLLLADDHAIVVEGLRRLLQLEFDFVGAVGDGRALLEAAERLKPDVIIADVSMPLLNGIEAVRRLKRICSRVKVIFLSMHGDIEVAVESLKAGASGYVLKHSAAEALSDAIWEVLEGRIYVSPRIARDVMSAVMESSHQKDEFAVQLTQRARSAPVGG